MKNLCARLLLAFLLLYPMASYAALDRAICTTADKGGTGACSGSQVVTGVNEELTHVYDIGIITLTSVAGTNTITATALPVLTAYIDGTHYDLKPAGANTGPATIAISGLPAKPLTGIAGGALIGGELVSGARMLIVYDAASDKFKLESQAATATIFGPSGSSHSQGLVPDPGSSAGTTKCLYEDGTFKTCGISVDTVFWTTLSRATDVSIVSNVTLTADTVLQFPMLANTNYYIEYGYTSINGNIATGFTGPSSPTLFFTHYYYQNTGGAASLGIAAYGAVYSNSGGGPAELYGQTTVKNGSNAGTFAMTFAQASSNATPSTVTGAFLRYRIY